MVLFLLEEDAHLHPVDGQGDVHEAFRLALRHVEAVQDVPRGDDVGESFGGDPEDLVLEIAHHPDPVLAVAVVQVRQDGVAVHAGGDEVRGHPEGAGIDGVGEVVRVGGHPGEEGAGCVGGEPGGVAADVREFQEDIVQQFRRGRDVRGGEDHPEPVPVGADVVVDEDFRGGGGSEGVLQALRAGEAVGVQQDDQVARRDAGEAGLGLRVVAQQRDAVRNDEADRGGGGVGQDGDGVLAPALPQVRDEGGHAAQRIPVGVRMGRDRHRPAAFQQGVQRPDVFRFDSVQSKLFFCDAKIQNILLFINDFCNFVGTLDKL